MHVLAILAFAASPACSPTEWQAPVEPDEVITLVSATAQNATIRITAPSKPGDSGKLETVAIGDRISTGHLLRSISGDHVVFYDPTCRSIVVD